MEFRWTAMKRGLRHWVKPALDTSRVERVYHRFDEVSGYREYLQRCQAASLAPMSPEPTQVLRERGFEHLRVLPAEEAVQLRETLLARTYPETSRKNTGIMARLHLDDAELEARLLSTVLSAPVADRIRAFFSSEFLVYWYTITRALPARALSRHSFLWHCDKGPQAHLKLLVYLNGTREHGGNTVLVDLETSRRMTATGYVFGHVDDRCEDLGALAHRAGIDFNPVVRALEAGEGLLFQPACVLHRGLLPETGQRVVVTLCLLPSPIPWHQARSRGIGIDPVTDGKWHRNALALWQRLAPGAEEHATATAATLPGPQTRA